MAKQPESNPWPGFVDALSTTLLVFVFLVVVLILVVTALSVQVGIDIAEAVSEAEHKAAGKTEGENSGQQATVEGNIDKEIVSGATEVQLESQVNTEFGEKLIRIKYMDFNARLTEEAGSELARWLQENLASMQDKTIYIISLLNARSIAKTTAYEVSFNRITQLRKVLTSAGLSGENIKIRLDDSGAEERNEVIIKVVGKEAEKES